MGGGGNKMVQNMLVPPPLSSLRSYRGYLSTSPWNPHPRLRVSGSAAPYNYGVISDGAADMNSRTIAKKMHLQTLPAELVEAILSQGINTQGVATLAQTCKRFSSLILEGLPEIWFALTMNHFSMDDLLSSPFGAQVVDSLKDGSGEESRLAYRALCRRCVCRQVASLPLLLYLERCTSVFIWYAGL